MDCSGNDCLPWITLEFFIILSLVKDFFIEKLKSSFVHHLQCHLKHCTSGFKMDLQRFRCCIKLMNKFTLFFSFSVWLINWKCHWRRKASTQKPEKSPTHTHTHTHTQVLGGGGLGSLFLHHNTKRSPWGALLELLRVQENKSIKTILKPLL